MSLAMNYLIDTTSRTFYILSAGSLHFGDKNFQCGTSNSNSRLVIHNFASALNSTLFPQLMFTHFRTSKLWWRIH